MYKAILSIILLIVILIVFYLAVSPQKNGDPVATSTYQEDFSSWSPFVPASGVFRVSFPATPQYFDDSIELPFVPEKGGYEIYASTTVNGSIFMVGCVIYPKNADPSSNPQETLKALVEQLSYIRPGNQIIDLKESEFDYNPALDFSVENKEFKIAGKAILVGQRAYILTYIARKSDFNPREYEHFIGSFSLLNPSYK